MSGERLSSARRKARKLELGKIRRHVFMCYDHKSAKCASAKEMSQAWKYLRRRVKQLELIDEVGKLESDADPSSATRLPPLRSAIALCEKAETTRDGRRLRFTATAPFPQRAVIALLAAELLGADGDKE